MELKHVTTYKGIPVVVTAGFDPVLKRFWMIVEPEDEHPDADEESGMIYSNLDDPDIDERKIQANLDYYRGKLKSMGIEVPDTFFTKVYHGND
jgi:hypothetical protein